MNVAIGAFILTLLFLPAISFRLAVNRLENLKGLLSTLSTTDSIWVFTIVPIIIHAILLFFFWITNIVVKFDLILNIIYSNPAFILDNNVLGIDTAKFLGYSLIGIIAGFFLGFLVNYIEERSKLISRIFGLGNEWYEAFEGDILNISGEEDDVSKIDLVYVDVLTNTKEASVLYSGILAKYYYKPKSTELDYLVLLEAVKRDLRKEYHTSGKSSFYEAKVGETMSIRGDYLIVPMKEVININISYLYMRRLANYINKLAE